jgi:WD40 repeat protein
MKRCTFCETNLDDRSMREGRCAACGLDLDWKEQGTERDTHWVTAIVDAAKDLLSHEGDESVDLRDTKVAIVSSAAESAAAQVAAPESATDCGGGDHANEPFAKRATITRAPSGTVPSFPDLDAAFRKESTLLGRRVTATIETATPAVSSEKIAGIWESTFLPGTSPRTTIRREDKTISAPNSRLVIKPRALGQKVEGEIKAGADYELLEVIGEGGVGVVYAARQASIDRTVAIKMLRPSNAASRDQRDKFLSEAVVTGDLDHPNIVPIYDLGTNETGALFYSMKRVQGTPWVNVMAQKGLPENLEILLKVADAIGFAHSRGIIHRDLKPENVMLGEYGEVLVMDWGLALRIPDPNKPAIASQSGSMGGTPAYMAPEMATGPLEILTPAADIYLLGAILYEIITKHPPHAGKTVMACLMAAARNQIQRTTHSGELLDIASKAMSTVPADRYSSARDFQAAVRQYQAHSESILLSERADEDLAEAEKTLRYELFSRSLFGYQEAYALWEGNHRAIAGISATKLAYARAAAANEDYDLASSLLDPADPAHGKLWTTVAHQQRERELRQHRLQNAKRVAIGLAASMLAVVTAALFIVSWLYRDAKHKRDIAEFAMNEAIQATGREQTERKRAETNQEEARRSEAKAEYSAYIAQIGLAAARVEENAFGEVEPLLDKCPKELRNWEWGRLKFVCGRATHTYRPAGEAAPVDSIAFDTKGQRFVSGSWDGKVRVWQINRPDSPEAELKYGASYVHAVAFSPDGEHVAIGGNDRSGYVKIWNLKSGAVRSFQGHRDAVLCVVFNATGDRLLTTSYDHSAKLWDVRTGTLVDSFEHNWWVWSAAFDPSSERIVTGSHDGVCTVWQIDGDPTQGNSTPTVFKSHRQAVYAVAFSPDGKQIASAGYDNRVLVWDAAEAKPFPFHKLSDGNEIADPTFRELRGHTAAVRTIRFAKLRDKNLLVSGGHDNTIKVWDLDAGRETHTLRGHAGWVRSCDLHGSMVLSGSKDGSVKLWNLDGYEEYRVIKGKVLSGHAAGLLSAVFSPRGQAILTASQDHTARMWDAHDGKLLNTYAEGHRFLTANAAFFDDNRYLLTAAMDNTVRKWDMASGAQIDVFENTGGSAILALSHNQKWLLTGGKPKEATLWDLEQKTPLQTFSGHRQDVTALAFSPDDSLVATCDISGRVQMFYAATGERLWRNDIHTAPINACLFTPDGKRLLTASSDDTVGQLSVETGEDLFREGLAHGAPVLSMAITRDGSWLVTAADDGKVRIWNLKERREEFLSGVEGRPSTVAISRDGSTFCTAGLVTGETTGDQSQGPKSVVQFWDFVTRKEIPDSRMNAGMIWSVTFPPRPGYVLLVGGRGARLEKIGGGETMNFSAHGAVASVNFSPDESTIVTAGSDAAVKLWNAQTGEALRKIATGHAGPVNWAEYSPQGDAILTASDDKSARLWDARAFEEVLRLDKHPLAVRHAGFSPDGQFIVTSCDDGVARVWTRKGELFAILRGHHAAVLRAKFSPDGKSIVTASEDNTARIWNVENFRHGGAPLVGHTAAVTSACFSPDNQRVLTSSADGSAKLWDTVERQEVLTLKGHAEAVMSAEFSPNGRSALTASRDGTAILWLTEEWRESSPAGEPAPNSRPDFALTPW